MSVEGYLAQVIQILSQTQVHYQNSQRHLSVTFVKQSSEQRLPAPIAGTFSLPRLLLQQPLPETIPFSAEQIEVLHSWVNLLSQYKNGTPFSQGQNRQK